VLHLADHAKVAREADEEPLGDSPAEQGTA
jgi:hypothetical protein